MATGRFQLHELLGNAGDASAWSQGKFTCIGCRRRFSSHQFETTVGSVCVSCVEKHLKKWSKTQDLLFWEVARMVNALSDDGPMNDRLTVLWKFHDALRYTSAKGPSKVSTFYKNLVKNLGYVQDHPLAQSVRQAAYQACITIGKPLVPTLLDLCQPTPWQFYANIVMVAGTVAPEHGEVQALLQQATQDSNPEISSRAQTVLHNIPAALGSKQDLLQSVLNALPKDLRNLVHVGVQESQGQQVPVRARARPKKASDYLPKQKQIQELLNAKYSADALKKIYMTHMQNLVDPDLYPDAGLAPQTLKKQSLAWIIARVYTDQELFEQFYARLPHEVKEVLKLLVWEGGEASAELLEKTYQVEMVRQTDSYRYGSVSQDVQDAYTLFLVRRDYRYNDYYGSKGNPYQYHFSLPDQLRRIFKKYLPHPPEYDLIPQKSVKKTDFQYVDSDHILQQLPLFYSYIEQGHLNFSKSTGKLLKNSIKQMAKYCHIQDFYDDSDKYLGYMRTRLLIDFCRAVTLKEPITSSPESLRAIFDKFFATTGYHDFSLSGLLWHVQGVHHADNYYYGDGPEKAVRGTLQTLLRAMPVQQWLSAKDLVQYCIYRDLSLEIVSKSSAARYVFYKREVSKNDYYYDNKVYLSAGIYKDALLLPFLKACMFLFASFGIVDIAYNASTNSMQQQAGRPYLSEFDGLRYVRLSPLGAYVLGLSTSYEAAIEEEYAQITLDEKRLLLTIEGQDRLKTLVIEKIAEKISESCYRVNYQSFLRECLSTQDIEKTIELFHTHISKNPPEIWKEFLQDVMAKINPLTPNQSVAVYKLANNKELRSLVARDEVLKKYIMKAEDFYIAIDVRHLSKVKKRLEEFGYLIDNL